VPLNWSFLLGPNSPSDGAVLAQLKVGNTLYIGTAGGTLAVFNIASPGAAVLVGSVDAGSPVWDIALIGTNAVLAQGPDGIGLIDVSNPATPSVLIPGTGGAGTDWATRVRTVGNRIYSNRGAALHVHDLTGGLTFANVAEVPADAWIVDIAAEAGRCIVATDGRGIVTFEPTAGGVLEKARLLGLEYPREISARDPPCRQHRLGRCLRRGARRGRHRQSRRSRRPRLEEVQEGRQFADP
jgi:hypothetical protein